ncbi:ATP-binding cassette subfamily C protein CydC [Castellaniella defragrans]|uniref:ATP-binding cassette subfamily C protein CydC n=2 Tax=Castellaniella defragrans TaxID=75697 RepID=A0A7W9TME4_CASDE|nr:ATP-binding cassette subfamily C protein CydC [Castellaniella defragrans]
MNPPDRPGRGSTDARQGDRPMGRGRLLRQIYRRHWPSLAATVALALLTAAAGAGLLGVAGWFLTGAALAGAASASAAQTFNLFAPSALVRGFSFIRIGARYAERLAGHTVTLHLLAELRGTLFRALARLSPRQLARYRSGDLVARLTSDVDALDTLFLTLMAPLLSALLAGLAMTAILAWQLPAAAGAVAAAFLAACLLVPALLLYQARAPGQAIQDSAAQLRTAVQEATEGHADILSLALSAPVLRHFDQSCRRAARARGVQAGLGAGGQSLIHAATGAALLAILWAGLDAVARGPMPPPVLAGLLLATLGLFETAGPVVRGAARMGAALAALTRIEAITGAEPDLHDPPAPRKLPAAGALQVRGLRYAYPEAPDRVVLDGIDLDFPPGSRTALTGASGSGKSTLLHLLLRLDDPQSGCIRFGGIDVRDCAQRDLHRRIALLAQDAPLFLGTIRTNLLIGDPQADDDALWHALDAARLGGFVRGLPHGLDTWIGETGAGLSVGQARRLALARVLLSPAAVLLLDEPTAGLDADTEAEFLADLPRATRGRTVVLATHAALPPGAVQHRVSLDASYPGVRAGHATPGEPSEPESPA